MRLIGVLLGSQISLLSLEHRLDWLKNTWLEHLEHAEADCRRLAASLGGPPSDVFTNALITDAETQP